MAAVYSGIHLKLTSPRTPWEDKLKLARFAWVSAQCVLPNKEQVLLDWVSHALTGYYNKKVEFSPAVLEGLWCYLDDLIHSKKFLLLLGQGKTISLRISMAQVLTERLQECVCGGSRPSVSVSTLLSVCEGIISSPALASIFTTKYELMVDLLAKFCSLACHRLQNTKPADPHPEAVSDSVESQDEPITTSQPAPPVGDADTEQSQSVKVTFSDQLITELDQSQSQPTEESHAGHVFEVLLQVLTCYLAVQRQQANPNRVFSTVANQLLQPIILLRHLLMSGELTHPQTQSHMLPRLRHQLSRDLRSKIDSVLQSALFPHEHLNLYKEELLPAKEDHGKHGPGGTKGPLRPVTTVLDKLNAQNYCKPTLHFAVKSNALPLLFKFGLESYGKGGGEEEKLLCFYLLARLVPTLDVALEASALPQNPSQPGHSSTGPESSPAALSSPESWSLALLAVETLLTQALSGDIYNVAADRIRHKEVQLSFYRGLAQTLFNHAQPSIPAWYRCLKLLLSLNHLILEPDLDQLLSSAWVDSDYMEPRVQRARQVLVSSLLQTYMKLRQLPRLISELLAVICQPALDNLRPPLLSEDVCTSLRTCLLDTPPSQGLEICSAVLDSIRKYILPDLKRQSGDRCGNEEMEVDETGEREGAEKDVPEGASDREREDASLKLFSLSQLLHAVLFSLKTVDNASPTPLVRQTHTLMENMGLIVAELLQLVSNKGKGTDGDSKKKKNKKRSKPSGTKQVLNQEQEAESEGLWRKKTWEGALLLRYTWVEVDTLFQIHCSKYTSGEVAKSLTPGHAETESSVQNPAALTALSHIEALLSGVILTSSFRHPLALLPLSPISSLLVKLLTLQQVKKTMLDSQLMAQAGTRALLTTASQFILAQVELGTNSNGEQKWDGQIGSVDDASYHVAHWHLVASNLPLLAPYLTTDGVHCFANVLLSSLLNRKTDKVGDKLPVSLLSDLSASLISSQILQSPILVEMPLVYSAIVKCLIQRIVGVVKVSDASQGQSTLLKFQDIEIAESQSQSVNLSESRGSEVSPSMMKLKLIVEEILSLSKTGDVSILLSETQVQDLMKILLVTENLNADGMCAEDLSTLLILLFFMLVSTSTLPNGGISSPTNPRNLSFLRKLLGLMAHLLEGRNSQSIFKLVHGSSLLQAFVSSLLTFSNKGIFSITCSSDWLDLVKVVQALIQCLVQLIITRNSSVRLNLEQFTTYLTSSNVAGKQLAAMTAQAASDPSESNIHDQPELRVVVMSHQLLLASLTSLSQVMTINLGKSKLLDQTLSQLLGRTAEVLGPAVQASLNILSAQIGRNSQPDNQVATFLSQAFLVEVVTVMLQSEQASLSAKASSSPTSGQQTLKHMSLYHSFNKQILKEINSAPRPMDFLLSSLHFLSAFCCVVNKRAGKVETDKVAGGREEMAGDGEEELYVQTLQNLYRLLAAPWLSVKDVCELEPAVEELLCHLLEGRSTAQFNLLLLLIREGLDAGKLREGNYREVLSAVIISKLLSSCSLPEPCSKALWLLAPQIISMLVFLVKESSLDLSLTASVTVPMVTALTSLLRQGEGRISNPHHVVMVLGALHSVPLDHLTSTVYQSAFLAVHEALFAIIHCHPQVMLKGAPAFLNVFYRLVASVMQEGRQKGDNDTGSSPDSEKGLLDCARLVERMYSHIAATAESFTTLSAFIVAQYITELQKVTVRPDIKAHLTEGIYSILDMCLEQDVKFLTAGLQMGLREVFNELYSSYTHYHKTQRQGEAKYTA